jgi:hypothetical protein
MPERLSECERAILLVFRGKLEHWQESLNTLSNEIVRQYKIGPHDKIDGATGEIIRGTDPEVEKVKNVEKVDSTNPIESKSNNT